MKCGKTCFESGRNLEPCAEPHCWVWYTETFGRPDAAFRRKSWTTETPEPALCQTLPLRLLTFLTLISFPPSRTVALPSHRVTGSPRTLAGLGTPSPISPQGTDCKDRRRFTERPGWTRKEPDGTLSEDYYLILTTCTGREKLNPHLLYKLHKVAEQKEGG